MGEPVQHSQCLLSSRTAGCSRAPQPSAGAHPLLPLQLFVRHQPPNVACLSCFTLIFLVLVLCGVGEGLGGTEYLTSGSVSSAGPGLLVQGHGLGVGTGVLGSVLGHRIGARSQAPGLVWGLGLG